jgi:hypothetical protein
MCPLVQDILLSIAEKGTDG